MSGLAREGTTEPVMRDKLSDSNGDVRGNSFSLFKLTTSRWRPYRVDAHSAESYNQSLKNTTITLHRENGEV